ncbi:MAG TPA: 16S rRNA (cytidine(1402)-2'-O)-methyltransferase [Candidatus Aminicenantes bacterium]|nr:16S rRNA (cytidine(1402)-2'-O)-methyltransferase [Candidatus Aminicenantes bacterium]HRY64043.1 16S rRNA (cytidine(1402)-2'-O)-methyltransferase [Candidatus Aminicenantes bacterium]HRZ70956.1 16S rRNA (cytidine(1402)-2'-O)-methyltransferase [Candidatus Aminicenantes bacterium]
MAGRLYIIATPIGNLEDITLRALRLLGEVAAIACEDTRQTVKILNRYGIKKPLLSYFQPREGQRIPEILGILEEGRDVALVSDAGTPGISDPGFPLIREALKKGVQVVPVPGPAAVTAALSAAGLPTHRFLFAGFPPPKPAGLRKLLLGLAAEEATLVFYLPTRRLAEFLAAVIETLGDRRVVVARELTKVHEEFLRGTASELAATIGARTIKGEATVLIEGL